MIKNTDIHDIGLSVRSTNALWNAKIWTVGDMVELTEDRVKRLRNCGEKSAKEILGAIDRYKSIVREEMLSDALEKATTEPEKLGSIEAFLFSPVSDENRLYSVLSAPEYHDIVVNYVRENDVTIGSADISNRSKNVLHRDNRKYMSDIMFRSEKEITKIANAGVAVVREIIGLINGYLDDNRSRIFAVICGDQNAVWTDEAIKAKILGLYSDMPFGDLSYNDIFDFVSDTYKIPEERISTVLGGMVENGVLYKWHNDLYCRVYPAFADYVAGCSWLDDRKRSVIGLRTQGDSLEIVGQKVGVTRERIRQISKDAVRRILLRHEADDNTSLFKEDRYRHLYTTYDLLAHVWASLGIDVSVMRYFEITCIEHGTVPIADALNDPEVDDDMKRKIWLYVNAENINIDGEMIPASRQSLEETFMRKYGHNVMTYDEFTEKFNKFLSDNNVPSGKAYYTDENAAYRFWRLSERRFILWQNGKTFRFYDIDNTDFTELLDTLNLDQYENTGFSTQVLIQKHPDLMKKYDIRNKYELHNLLRKIISDGSFHDMRFGRMPSIIFGEFNMKAAMLDLLSENAPIRETELIRMVSEKYGYDTSVIISNWSDVFIPYRCNGMLNIGYKTIPEDRRVRLLSELPGEVYSIQEVGEIYEGLFPGADKEEINPYSLREIGFSTTPNAAYRGYSSLRKCFAHIVKGSTDEELDTLKKRFGGNQSLSNAIRDVTRVREAS